MRWAAVIGGLMLAAAAVAQAPRDARTRLIEAKQQSAQAAERAARLDAAAAQQADAAKQARDAEAAVAARIAGAQADIVAAQARNAILHRLLDDQRARLAAAQGPIVRLIAALQSLAARPPIVAVAQPGSVDDLVHVRAVLGSAIPVVQAKTQSIRAALERTRELEGATGLAAKALADGRAKLEDRRLELVRLEASHRFRARALGRDAMFQSDRAIALGERARDLVGSMDSDAAAAQSRSTLASLPGPLPRPDKAGESAGGDTIVTADGAPPYRLPVTGRIVTGLGEISAAGVRSRGLTIAVAAGADVVAPAAGRIVYAGKFRDYGTVVIVDHGGGWTSAITGLGDTRVEIGDRVRPGSRIGRAASGDDATVTVELRRKGRAIDMTPLLG